MLSRADDFTSHNESFIWVYGNTRIQAGTSTDYNVYFTQNGVSLSWYEQTDVEAQMNQSGTTYHYVGVGA